MTKLTVDPALEAKLTVPAELTNNAGRTVGYFLTPDEHELLRKLEAENCRRTYEQANAVFSEEQLDAFDREGGELTYDEVKRDLELQ
jgi:DNA-binding MarR family transcriptional regulator